MATSDHNTGSSDDLPTPPGVSFGAGAQTGDVTIGDMAGRDVHKVQVDGAVGQLINQQIIHQSAPAPAAPAFQVPYPPNPLFRGRDAELAVLARVLLSTEGGTAAVVPAIAGTGGIGKTQLAAEFAHRYRDQFPGGVFWLNMEQPGEVARQVAACAGPDGLNLPGWQALSSEEQLRAVQRAWNEPVRRLIVFDNLEHPQLLQTWRPQGLQARVLVTTRRGLWSAHLGVQPVPLQTLARAESLQVLLTPRAQSQGRSAVALLADPAAAQAADAICEQVGDLPLALTLAGAALEARARLTLADYARQLGEEAIAHPSLNADLQELLPTRHAPSIIATIALSYDQLDPATETDALAQRVLHRAAYLAPVPIPWGLLATLSDYEADDEGAMEGVETAVRRLAILGLVELLPEDGAVLHRLIAAFARTRSAEPPEGTLLHWMVASALGTVNRKGFPLDGRPYLPHAAAVLGQGADEATHERAWCLNEVGLLLKALGDLQGARPYLERALAIYEQVQGSNHPETALSLNNLGLLLNEMGDLEGARPYLERALAIYEQVQGSNHLETALSLNNLGLLLNDLGDFEGARPYLERALAIREQVLGPNHPNTATSVNNLGYLLYALGDLQEARPYLERALAIYEQVLGPNHPNTATSVNNLGMLLNDLGNLEGARPYLERALAIREQVLGPNHPDMAASVNNLGILLNDLGDFEGARPYLERALAIYEQVLGADHPYTLTVRQNLASLS